MFYNVKCKHSITSYSKSLIKNSGNYGGVVIYSSSTLIYADYWNNHLYSVSVNSNDSTHLGLALGSFGVYSNLCKK